MIATTNSLPVKKGAADEVAERFTGSRGNVQNFPGFVSIEVLKSEEEVLVVTRWESREAFDEWVGSDDFKKAHSRGGTGELLSGHPKMSSYEVAVERAAR